jgi:CYTH domain-containing protein
VDVFHDANDGLIVAEIELESEDEKYELPDWVLQEVTDDARYYNSNLTLNPFKQWK